MSNRFQIKLQPILLCIVFLLLPLNTFNRAVSEKLINVGNVTIHVTIAIMVIIFCKSFFGKRTVYSKTRDIYLMALSYVIICFISFLLSRHVDVFYFMQFIGFILFILAAVKIQWNLNYLRIFSYILGAATFLLFFHWVGLNFPTHRFKSIFQNPNFLGVFLFCMLYFKVLMVKYGEKWERFIFITLIVFNMILMICSNSRAVMVGIFIVLLSWIIFNRFKYLYSRIFILIVSVNILFLLLYIKLKETTIGQALNELCAAFFGKPLYSGRGVLWYEILQKIKEKPLFGYGFGISAKDVTAFNLTAHNQYLQILLEVGLVGFLIFLLLLYSIWRILKQSKNFASNMSACFYVGILVYENFELTLFQNNYPIAMFQWLIITYGINFKMDSSSKT